MISQESVRRVNDARQSPKELEILKVASDSFLKNGFEGTSINAMARNSGISKESIYRYFSSKQALFEAVIAKELAEYQDKMEFLEDEIAEQDLEDALINTAETILNVINSERTLALRRLIFNEVATYPDVGAFYYDTGPEEAYRHLERIFEQHRDRTEFDLADLGRYYVGMILHNLMLRRQCGLAAKLDGAEKQALSRKVTRDFLRAFFSD